MIVKIDNIEAALTKVIQKLKSLKINEVYIKENLYWNIANDRIHAMESNNLAPDIGDLREDHEDILRLLKGEQAPLAYHLIPISALLREIGANISLTRSQDGI
ncbi:hypothetical protein ACQR53_01020 [Xanthomonas oryzae]|uniref:hypothetical protein n=1 Tax=Xanthomonas oryzae TaxID=347 RepID=UPI00103368F1|nr:hypothetical protein [Xanthomonas oryzae]QBG89686.1 hypothetical protein EYC54_21135 [Xanthomonas oryzae]